MRIPIARIIMNAISLRKAFKGVYAELDEIKKELGIKDQSKKVKNNKKQIKENE